MKKLIEEYVTPNGHAVRITVTHSNYILVNCNGISIPCSNLSIARSVARRIEDYIPKQKTENNIQQ